LTPNLKFAIVWKKFPNLEVADPTQTEQQKNELTQPGSKNFDPYPSLPELQMIKLFR